MRVFLISTINGCKEIKNEITRLYILILTFLQFFRFWFLLVLLCIPLLAKMIIFHFALGWVHHIISFSIDLIVDIKSLSPLCFFCLAKTNRR